MIGLIFFSVMGLLIWLAIVIGRKVGGRAKLGFPLGVVGLYVLAQSWPLGWVDVQIACWRDGGLRGTPPKVTGFWYDERYSTVVRCEPCEKLVSLGQFEYVDYQAGLSVPAQGIVTGRFYRVSLGNGTDAACRAPLISRGLPAPPRGRCITITALAGPVTDGYQYTWGSRAVEGLLGSRLNMGEDVLKSVSTGKILFSSRRYNYGSPLNRWLTGGGDTLYRCPRKAVDPNEFVSLFSLASHRE